MILKKLKVGTQVKVKLSKELGPNRYKVIDQFGNEGLLIVKGNLRIKNNQVSVWVKQIDSRKQMYYYVNSYFGKYSITQNISQKYLTAIDKIFTDPKKLSSDDISTLKGMCNRCLKHDQWDWYTTWEYLGKPHYSELRLFVKKSILIRDQIRENDFSGINGFKDEFINLLTHMRFRLMKKFEISDDEVGHAPANVSSELWSSLSQSSRLSMKIAIRFYQLNHSYLAMYFFSTLEREVNNKYIRPHVESLAHLERSDQKKYHIVESILTGKSHFSLGAIKFIHTFINSENACTRSEIIATYRSLIIGEIDNFNQLTEKIYGKKFQTLNIIDIRNGLAHGDDHISSMIDTSFFELLIDFMLTSHDPLLSFVR